MGAVLTVGAAPIGCRWLTAPAEPEAEAGAAFRRMASRASDVHDGPSVRPRLPVCDVICP
jgi:hypothetical protein